MPGHAGHLGLLGREVGKDSCYVEIRDGLLAFRGEEEVAVGVVVHEEVLRQDGWCRGMA